MLDFTASKMKFNSTVISSFSQKSYVLNSVSSRFVIEHEINMNPLIFILCFLEYISTILIECKTDVD